MENALGMEPFRVAGRAQWPMRASCCRSAAWAWYGQQSMELACCEFCCPLNEFTRWLCAGSSAKGVRTMPQCEVCGNDYDKPLEIRWAGKTHIFDSFECAIRALAPRCHHCGVRIIGHGLEAGGKFYCCAHCAKAEGQDALRDRA
jgi:hypothetical protein